MDNLFDAFEIESIETEEILDTNPDIYVKRAEGALRNKMYSEALIEIDNAVTYSNNSVHYILEKIKILSASSYIDMKLREQCLKYISTNIKYFYDIMTLTQFVEVVWYYNECFKTGNSNIKQVLINNRIPFMIADEIYKNQFVSTEIIIRNAQNAYFDRNLEDALEHIKILESKNKMEDASFVIKGDILKKLNRYDEAIDCYRIVWINKPMDIFMGLKMLNTKILKHKKAIILISLLIANILLIQGIMFNKGIIPSKIKSYELNISNGRYIKDYGDSVIIPVDETVSIDINYELVPFYGNAGEIEYTIDDEDIATFESNNNIKALSEGETKLNLIKDGKIVYSFGVMVVKPSIEEVHLELSDYINHVGDEAYIETNINRNYDFGEENDITYSSTDESVVMVDEEGRVSAVGIGTATIIASCDGVNAEETVVISAEVVGMDVSSELKLEVGDTHTLEVEVYTNPQNAKHSPITFQLGRSNNTNSLYYSEEILEVNENGEIKALSPGMQEIIVTCDDYEQRVIVTVNKKTITNSQVKNIKSTYQVEGNYLYIDLTWDKLAIETSHNYNIYARSNSSDEFTRIDSISSTNATNMSSKIKYNLENINGNVNIEIYIIASNYAEESKISEIINVKFNHKNANDISNKNILDYRDESIYYDDYVYTRIEWTTFDVGCNYHVYVRDNLSQGDFVLKNTLYETSGKSTYYSLGRLYENVDVDIYVIAENDYGKSKPSKIINIRQIKEDINNSID